MTGEGSFDGPGMGPGAAFRRKLESGGIGVGVTLNFPNASLAEFLGWLGFDCVVLDGEHGGLTDSQVEEVARAADVSDACSLVRLPMDPGLAERYLLERYLGMGVIGFQVPRITSAAEVRKLIDAIQFPPVGRRGIGSFRAARWDLEAQEYPVMMETSNASTVLMVAIEDLKGKAALAEILAFPEITVVQVGPYDLSSDLGYPGQANHPTVRRTVDEMVRQINDAGKVAGLPANNPVEMREAIDRGARYVLTGVTHCLRSGARPLLDAAS